MEIWRTVSKNKTSLGSRRPQWARARLCAGPRRSSWAQGPLLTGVSPRFLWLLFFLLKLAAGDPAMQTTLFADFVEISDINDARGILGGHNASWYPCSENLCRCFRYIAYCGNLTYIPQLPESVTSLVFRNNGVTEIRNCTFFVNVTNITHLDFGNGLTYIVSDAFRLLTKLENLSLSDNSLNNSAIPATFNITTLRQLNLTNNNIGPLAHNTFHIYPIPHLVTLILHQNHVGHCGNLNLSVFVPLKNLTSLELFANEISDIFPSHIGSLGILDLAFNYLHTFPDTCSTNGTSLFPELRKLLLDYNFISSVRRDVCLPRLEMLDLNANYLVRLDESNLNLYMFPSLITVYLADMHAGVIAIKDKAFRSTSLQSVSLMYNWVDFGKDNIDPRCFAGAPKLRHLQLSHNFFDSVSDAKWILLFGNLTSLHHLYIENAYVSEIPSVFANLLSLQSLTMSFNDITNIPDSVFDTQPNLTSLKLNDNSIAVIPQSTFSASTRQRLSHLDLSGNPFTCACEVMWFRDWLVTKPGLFQQSWSTYECDNVAHTNLTSFYMSEQACLMSRHTARLVTVSVSMLISGMTLLTLLYRYRWHLRLVLYEAFRGRGEARRRHLQRQDFLYDVFVSYATPDLPWVRAHLMPQLEEGLGLRLCLHDRDFIPGHPIVGNIEESVQSSKKVLMVFSSHFTRSQWCQFELTLCLSHVMEHEDALLVVLLHDVPTHDLTSAMMAVLRTTTYIEWAQYPDAEASFWGRMRIALQEILPIRRQHSPWDNFA